MNNIIESVITIISYIFFYNINIRYKIYKDFNNNKEIKLVNPNKFKVFFEKKDEERLKKIKLSKDILKFKNTLEDNIDNESLNNLYNNLKTLKVEEHTIFFRNLLLQMVGGSYVPRKNKIKTLKFIKDNVINHELLHMASTAYNVKEKKYLCGFAQYSPHYTKRFGIGLNEGYTELLNERYFGKNDKCSKVYKLCQFYSKMLEEIIGQEKMTNAYLNGDLPNLIKELKKYDNKENIVKFIKNLDFTLNYMNLANTPIIFYKKDILEKLTITLSEINNSLIKWYVKKKNNELKEKKITSGNFINDVYIYYNSIKNYILIDEIKKLDFKVLKKLDIPTKNIENYSQVKMINKRYNY